MAHVSEIKRINTLNINGRKYLTFPQVLMGYYLG